MAKNQQQNDKQPPEIGADADNNESITNICYNCIVRIFDRLDLDNLLNVASTCRRLQVAAAVYFANVYGRETVELSIQRNDWNNPGIRPNEGINTVAVNGLKFCLPFLRCFGAKIPKLAVFYDQRDFDDNNYVDRYINQFCAKTLKSISFYEKPKFSIEKFTNPFESVEKVCIEYIDLGEQLLYFVALFPSLRHLTMTFVSIDENCANIRFPNLENLIISVGRQDFFTMKSLMAFLHANPQLHKLMLDTDDRRERTWNELLNMIKGNPLIIKLHVWNSFSTNINQTDLAQFASEHPFMIVLNLSGCRIEPQDAIVFIRQLKSLKIFEFEINNQAEYNELVSQLDSEWELKQDIYGSEHLITLMR